MTTSERRLHTADLHDAGYDEEAVTVAGSFGALFELLVRRRRLIIATSAALVAIVLMYNLMLERTYTSTASFVSQSGRTQSSSLGGIAAQFGIAIPNDAGTDSPQFYLDLITSRAILDTVVGTRYNLPTASGIKATSLLDVFDAKGDNLPQRTAYAERKLREHLSGTIGKQTGVVNVSVTTPNAILSKLVVARILDAINAFNLQKRQSRATAERRFTEERLATAKAELLAAENRLQDFMQENRVYNTAPRLSFEQDRLSRDVQNRQQIVNVLSQSFEQAKIDEVRDTPVITVLDAPDVPPNPDSRGLLAKVIFSLLSGALLGVFIAWLQEERRGRADLTVPVAR